MTETRATARLASNHRPSTDLLRTNPDWAKLPIFERKGWKRLPFAAFAESVNERVEPANAAEVIYVGLDDLDSCDIHIRRWGKGSDVIGTKLRFRKGDIIFGRRRAYQRKLAVAEMDGICSAHAMVVRAKPEMVLPEFLPFLMMSDKFMNRAVEISVGSLSPTINWTTLKLEDFDLPPLDQQTRIAEILWAIDTLIESNQTELADAVELRDARVRQAAESSKSSVSLGELATSITSGSRGWAEHYSSEGPIFLRIANLQRRNIRFDWREIQRVSPPETKEALRTRVKNGDVLISITAELGLIAFADQLLDECYINQHIAMVSLDQTIYDPYLASMFLCLPPYADQFRKLNDQGAKAGMNLKNVAKLRLPALSLGEQLNRAAEIRAAESIIDSLRINEEALSALRKRLIRYLVEGR